MAVFTLFADYDKIVESNSRAELRGFLRNSDFKTWAKASGYKTIFITIDGTLTFDCIEIS